jgi:putative phage-type endonuclease
MKNLEQGSPEWKEARLGHVTASCMTDVMSKGKAGESATRNSYKLKLVAERLSGKISESFTNAAMEWGIQQEEAAAMTYEATQGVFVDKTGFWLHEKIKWLGVSPDRLVGDRGLIEIKCPNTNTHLDYLLTKKVPAKYYMQIQCQLWVTDRDWCDFVSFDPRLTRKNQLLVIRVERDEDLISLMEVEVKLFIAEVNSIITKLGE